jgi:two-component system response regulator WspF
MTSLRIGIVNDLPIAREAIRRAVVAGSAHRIAWLAEDGIQAISLCAEDRPDVILMDMVMPGLDGVEATRRIMRSTPCPILVVTASVEGNAGRVYDALGAGALDAVPTPTIGIGGEIGGGAALLRKLDLLSIPETAIVPTDRSTIRPAAPIASRSGPLLAIGASTGGPKALATLLAGIARPVLAPILVVQHLGSDYVPGLAAWLHSASGLPMMLVDGPTLLSPGTVYLARDERHLVCEAPGSVSVSTEPRAAIHRPSVDVLFNSLLRSGCAGVAALLTGMGRDGADGLLLLRQGGWWTIAQDQASSVVWGMPGEAVRRDAASEVLGIDEMPWAVSRALARSGSREQDMMDRVPPRAAGGGR